VGKIMRCSKIIIEMRTQICGLHVASLSISQPYLHASIPRLQQQFSTGTNGLDVPRLATRPDRCGDESLNRLERHVLVLYTFSSSCLLLISLSNEADFGTPSKKAAESMLTIY
jgi:hypothetical protein